MKKRLLILLSCSTIFHFSCSDGSKSPKITPTAAEAKALDDKIGKPEFSLESITSNFMAYWSYHTRKVKLYRNFTPINEDGKIITKLDFLKKLTTGNYLPLLIHTADSLSSYKLAKIPSNLLEDLGRTIAQYAQTQLIFFKTEGKPVPKFSFKDINGVEYDSEKLKGKIILFKCWFIKCGACVLEMPALNRMVNQYKDRKDIVFVSLAIDKQKPLQEFLTKTKFDYAVVPNMDSYMVNDLKVSSYPTHFLIDKSGKISKIVQDADEIAEVLKPLADQ